MTRPSSDQRPHHHGALREVLIEAAEKVVEEGQATALTLREIARRAEVSHNAPYSHFASKQALLAEVGARGFEALEAGLVQALEQTPEDPVRGFLQAGVAYVRFGLQHEGRYRLMFSTELSVGAGLERLRSSRARAIKVLEEIIGAGAALGLIGHEDRLSLAAWSLLHGLTMLMLNDRVGLAHAQADAEVLAEQVGRILLNGMMVKAVDVCGATASSEEL